MIDFITSTTSYQWVLPITQNMIVITIDACIALVVGSAIYNVYQVWR